MNKFEINLQHYFSDSNPNQVSIQEFENALDYFKVDKNVQGTQSIFDSKEIDRNQFVNALAKIKQVDPNDSELQANANIIFDFYNIDRNETLSIEELSSLNDNTGNYNGQIVLTNFSVWNTMPLHHYDATAALQRIQEETTGTETESDETESTSSTSETTEPAEAQYNDPSEQLNGPMLDYYKKIIELIEKHDGKYTPEYYIDYLLKNDENMTEEIAKQLRSAFTTYDAEGESQIQERLDLMKISDPTATRLDAIEELKSEGVVLNTLTTSESEYDDIKENLKITPKKTVDEKIEAARLYRAFHPTGPQCTDEKTLKEILGEDSDMSSADIVAIAKAYNNTTEYYNDEGSLIRTIDKETSGPDREAIAGGYAKHLIQAAIDGVPDATDLIADELYEAGEHRTGTCDEFISVILSDTYGLPDNLLAKVKDAYNKKYKEKGGLAEAIADEYFNTTADNYKYKIENAKAD